MSEPTPDDRHPFKMNVKDGLDRDSSIELVARSRQVIISSPLPSGYWLIKLTPDQADTLSAAIRGASPHSFTMYVKDGLDRDRPIELVARDRQVIIASPVNYWSIKLTPDQADTLSAAVEGASDRARSQRSS